ncbi:hypothetical protein ABW19_dt0203145 [Dactylella cylindrospora]|nr:hypothetical protein ABW19_dt0203145 [Dactylella cylindrospora]
MVFKGIAEKFKESKKKGTEVDFNKTEKRLLKAIEEHVADVHAADNQAEKRKAEANCDDSSSAKKLRLVESEPEAGASNMASTSGTAPPPTAPAPPPPAAPTLPALPNIDPVPWVMANADNCAFCLLEGRAVDRANRAFCAAHNHEYLGYVGFRRNITFGSTYCTCWKCGSPFGGGSHPGGICISREILRPITYAVGRTDAVRQALRQNAHQLTSPANLITEAAFFNWAQGEGVVPNGWTLLIRLLQLGILH